MEYEVICHHGVKGQKWGVRRYQNKDGTLTDAGKKRTVKNRKSDPERRKAIGKKVAIATAATLTVAAVAAYAASPQVRQVVNSAAKKIGTKTVTAIKTGNAKAIAAGKSYVKSSIAGLKEGVKEAAKEAPKKAVKAVIIGATMNATKRALDASVGKKEAERIMKANNSKKIDSFWKVHEVREDDD